MTTPIFKTACKEEREARDLAIYKEWNELVSIDGQSKTRVIDFLMDKYGIHSPGTIYVIRQRVEQRLAEQERKEAAI